MDLLFARGGSRIRPTAERTLRLIAPAVARRRARGTILVEGHSDGVGSPARQVRVSARRAVAVKRWLVRRGLPARRIRAIGHGGAYPAGANDTAVGRVSSRRVVVSVSD